jgi:hypothetical protein
LDDKSGAKNTSFMNVDTGLGLVCLAGQVQEFDNTVIPSRSVTFTYRSIGEIRKTTDKKVQADFGSVLLTLEIVMVPGVQEYQQTITFPCKLRASLQKAGSQDGVKLNCELGDNFAAFSGLTNALIENINHAFGKQKRAKTTKHGGLKIPHRGVPTEGVGLSCPLGED